MIVFSKTGNVWRGTLAAEGINQRSVRRWREEDEQFAQDYIDAKKQANLRLVNSVREWAEEGIDEVLVYQGTPTGHKVKKRSERMMDSILEVEGLKRPIGGHVDDDVPPDYRYL